jgi:hypothetical protein
MAAYVAVDPRGGGGIDEINVPRIYCIKLAHQISLPAQIIFLMVIFRQVEPTERHNFGLDLPVSLFFLESFRFKRQLTKLYLSKKAIQFVKKGFLKILARIDKRLV